MWRDIWTFLGERPGIAVCGLVWVAAVLPLSIAAVLSRRQAVEKAKFDWRLLALAAWALFALGGVTLLLSAPWYLVLVLIAYIASLAVTPRQIQRRKWTGGRAAAARLAPSLLIILVFLPWLSILVQDSWSVWKVFRAQAATTYVEKGQWNGLPTSAGNIKARILRVEHAGPDQAWVSRTGKHKPCWSLTLPERHWLVCENKDGYAERIVISSNPKPGERDAVHLANARRLFWVMMNAPHDADAAKVVKTGSATVEGYDFTLHEFEGVGATMIVMAHWELLD